MFLLTLLHELHSAFGARALPVQKSVLRVSALLSHAYVTGHSSTLSLLSQYLSPML